MWNGTLNKVDDFRYRIPRSYKRGMRVAGMIYASPQLIDCIKKDQSPEQVANVATLPGIVGYSLAMPDIHWGYGFCIGGVAATDPSEGGVVSPGGVGYDINCGIRLLRSNFRAEDIRDKIDGLIRKLFEKVPAGIGRGGNFKYSKDELRAIMSRGAGWLAEKGWATDRDIECCESEGCMADANPDVVSKRAFERGTNQCGTLGSGNHFLELQEVVDIFDDEAAKTFGLYEGQFVLMIHSGSRGLGYQICDDAIRELREIPEKLGFELPDRQLACAPVESREGKRYLQAMRCAANFAWSNRQLLTHLSREIITDFLQCGIDEIGLELVYDVAHNIAKMEWHSVEGSEEKRLLCVHRKGATRAFPAGNSELPERYRRVGQPVIIPGDMGRASYIMLGKPRAMKETFGSVCHGAGRVLSRKAAIRASEGRSIQDELYAKGIVALSRDRQGLKEEQSAAYKDISSVVNAVSGAGLAKKVAKMRPLAVIKG